jgi:glutathione S-transferase
MADLILTTFDWVPELPRGFVRDLRVRWALEEAGLHYRVEGVPFGDRTPAHFAHQPFGQGAVVDRWRYLDLRERRSLLILAS